ncbi:hypothetical protein RND81_03G023000 [Saponaria officinalis]|uniref:DC1 domain-containing protein n=1 Tax=Saponaria officinalis TaxID=3572 RepID=A0AAW1M2Q3_SAPOF
MLSRRSSFKNQTCPVVRKYDAAQKPVETAATITPFPSSLPLSQTKFIQKSNSIGNHEYGQDLQTLSRSQSTKFTQRTNSVGYQDHGLSDQHPLSRTQSIKVTQRTNSVGPQGYDHDNTQSAKVTLRTNSAGNQVYGHDLQPVSRTQSFKVTQRTNSVGDLEYGQPKPTKLAQKANSFSHGQQPLPLCQPTKVTQRTNSVGHHEYEHDLQLALPKKSAPIIEFPVSPELDPLVVGDGITNANHPQHRMVHVNLPNPFTCMGCKEYGAGTRFTCQQCNFELHDFCALAPPVLKAHPLHSQHQLLFNPKPGKGGILRSKCDVCGKPTKGYLFHCSACSYQLHPCCAMLSAKMKFPTHTHPLVILPASANSLLGGDPGELPCAECKRKRSGQVYRCTVCDYYLHAVCAKNMVNGLHENGIRGLDKPSVLGVAAKIASHVVVGFMGGLIEGLGEGLGEALTQNFAKGRCNSARKSLYPGN